MAVRKTASLAELDFSEPTFVDGIVFGLLPTEQVGVDLDVAEVDREAPAPHRQPLQVGHLSRFNESESVKV